MTIRGMEIQRDELIAALKKIRAMKPGNLIADIVNAAIARAEGGA